LLCLPAFLAVRLGDGRVVPLVNVPELLEWIATTSRQEQDKPYNYWYQHSKDTILVDDSINVRRFIVDFRKAGYLQNKLKMVQRESKNFKWIAIKAVICDVDMPVLVMVC